MCLTDTQEALLIDVLDSLSGAEVRQLFTDFHGCQLLTEEFARHCVEEGFAEADEIGLPTDDDEDEEEEG